MTKDEAAEVIRKTLTSVDKAVGVVGIRESEHEFGFFDVDLMKRGTKLRVSVEGIILMGAEADLMKHSSGYEGDKALGDLKNQLKQAISEQTSP